jgi:hypothetical protein
LGLAASTPALAQQAVQWRVEDGGNGHWYRLRAASTNQWSAEQASAAGIGAHLATFSSNAERQFIADNYPNQRGFPGSRGAFMGMYQDTGSSSYSEPAGGWRWVTGEPVGYWPFGGGEPNDAAGGQNWTLAYIGAWVFDDWRPGTCCNPCCSLLEWSADCDGNGIIDYGEILDGTLEDTNANGVPDCCDAGVSCDPCPGDLNDSNTVDAEDLAYVLFAWGTDGGKTPEADINRDGTVNANDLSIVLGSWGPCPN